MEKIDLKIFVSHRIDLDSGTIASPIYVPVRCGAAMDPRGECAIQGDHTGDNISLKRMSFCELTVQYWAWKNVEATHYGLCHYRRYFSFADRKFSVNPWMLICEPAIHPLSINKHHLADEELIKGEVAKYDAIVAVTAPVDNRSFAGKVPTNVEEFWAAYDGCFYEKKYRKMVLELVEERAPEYMLSAREYFASKRERGFNCFIMKRELFQKFCEFEFPILFELERRMDTTGYTENLRRTPAYLGEILYGIFVHHLINHTSYKVKEAYLVFFDSTKPDCGILQYYLRSFKVCSMNYIRKIAEVFFPIGSKRRQNLKQLLRKL